MASQPNDGKVVPFVRNRNVPDEEQARETKPKSNKRAPKQLELKLDREREVVFLGTNSITNPVFLRTIVDLQAKFVFDVRYVARFDFSGRPSRVAYNALLENCGRYFPVPFAFHSSIDTPELGAKLTELGEDIVRRMKDINTGINGPILLLVDEARHGRLSGQVVASVLTSETGRDWFSSDAMSER
ncbi:hypothetical protein [Azospirillum rugosum]|uniref:AAA domain-containing protein n=1 Tax=Azospirillum rugosum TaxID=416170 RepID=A0ABS4SLF5_9PROT|nr:hypothetical protein [Azospirillum rugosum]MBP2292240.1 hypothetical protein [Azospirillum rugosum]MDQ0525999.1 hypothetical protein [Azospirillum rugosum]